MKTPALFGFQRLKLDLSSRLVAYSLAVLAVALMTLVRGLLSPVLGDDLPYSFFYFAIIFSFWRGGSAPALLAMILGFLAGNWLFVTPSQSFDLSTIARQIDALLYLLLGGVLIGGGQSLRDSSLALLDRQQALERQMNDREQLEEKSRQQIQEMEAIYQGAPLGFALIDPQMRYLRLNQALATINGIPIEQSLGRTKREVLGELADHVVPIFHQVLRSGQPFQLELEGAPPGSPQRQRHFWMALYPLRDSNGQVRAVSCILQDITERKEAQQMNAYLAAIVRSSGEAIISTTLDGVITSWSPAAEKMFGFTTQEMIGQNVSLLTPPHLYEEFLVLLQDLAHGKTLVGVETVRRTKDGALIDVILNLSPLQEPGGRILGVMRLIQDITGRKKAERVLRESEARLSLAMDVARLGFWEWELPSSMLYVSERCLEMFAVKPGQLVDYYDYWVKSLHPDDRDRVTNALTEALQNKSNYDVDYRIVWPDGSIHWISAKGRILASQRDKPCRMIGVLNDVTRRKQAELALHDTQEQLAQKNRELERKVQERTAQLQEALVDLEHFSYGIAHDLRAPLRTMSQFAYLVRHQSAEKLDDPSKDFLEGIITGAGRADRLIQNVLAFSRIARTDLKLIPVDLAAVVREVVQTYPVLQPPAAELEIHIYSVRVLGHPAALTQCISNFLLNAVKFMPPETCPRVKIWTEPRDGQTRFFVQDNGIGIEKENLPRVWRVFERLSANQNYEGSGIGLSIVRKAIERMGGTVGVESEPGHGSTFWFQLETA